MRWDNVVAMFLMVAFVIYITLRGELPVYAGFLLSPAAAPIPVASKGPVGGEDKGAGAGGIPGISGSGGEGIDTATLLRMAPMVFGAPPM